VLLAAAVWCWWFSWRGSVPFEDAEMLFRYVDNVVAGHGVVWNVGEAPVAGATDLGFTFLLGSALFFLSPAATLIHAGFGAVFFGASIALVKGRPVCSPPRY
jgi:triacylglycerol esterase/lipase EstA (alpha/beta hydrolase family)